MRHLSYSLICAVTAVAACQKPAAKSPASATTAIPDFHKPADPGFSAQAPDSFRARFSTTKGDFVIEVHRAWAPRGADRFYGLVRSVFYDGVRFFRVMPGFMAQLGTHSDTTVTAVWREHRTPDDPVRRPNVRGMVTFATAGPGTRTTQIFINYRNNDRLDAMGFPPFGQVVVGMDVVDELCGGDGEAGPQGPGPEPYRLNGDGEKARPPTIPQR